MRPLRVVLDTNVYIAAALNPKSALYQLVEDSAAHYLAEYYTSPEILAELQEKLEGKFNFKRSDVVRWITQLEQVVTVIRPQKKIDVVGDDPDDNKILECAVEAKADLIVSADRHLYKLKEYKGIKIIHPTSLKYIFPQLKKPEN
ncbi:MAG TPA: putative toxin-antitoxin system toxin component, PIN family [Candidatus Saccharimonadales bacterium]|nr:putative toxin-antitoxin system toxin component, PIN family [Candidatus Saccharimonadales bacterium]